MAAWTISWHTRVAAADVDLSIGAFVYASSSELMQSSKSIRKLGWQVLWLTCCVPEQINGTNKPD
jgi:hypothetical protein